VTIEAQFKNGKPDNKSCITTSAVDGDYTLKFANNLILWI